VSRLQCSVYGPLKSKRAVPRDGADYTGPHNRWGGSVGSRSGLRGGTSREALFPPQLFKDVSCGTVTSPFCQTRHSQMTHTVAILIVVFLHSFCFTDWNLLYRHLFPGEILTGPETRIRQPWRADVPPVVLGRRRDVSTRCGDGFSSLFIGIHACLHSGCMVHGLLASKRGNMNGQKWISFVGLIIGAVGFGASIKSLLSAAF
jgi:hypothetical protein